MANHFHAKATSILLLILFLNFFSNTNAQCYSINGTETVYDQSTSAITNTLNTCKSYKFSYSLTHNSGSSVTDQITVSLPLGVSYASLGTTSGATITYASGTTAPVFNVSGWAAGTNLDFEVIVTTPSCVINPALSNITEIEGSNTCSASSFPNSLVIAAPTMLVVNVFGSAPVLKNTGDVSELIFKIRNISTNGSSIEQVSFSPTADVTIDFLGDYYLSTASTIPSGTNIYSYVYPAAATGLYTTHQAITSTINIGSSDWTNLLSGPSLLQNEEIYVHIPYVAKRCGTGPGSCQFNLICGTDVCSTQSLASNISVVSGNPVIGVLSSGATEDGTFCPNSPSDVDAAFAYTYTNNGTTVANAPVGNAKAVDLKVYLYGLADFGTNDVNSFVLQDGLNSFPIPPAIVTTSVVMYGGKPYNVYEIDFSALPIGSFGGPPYDPYPLGANSLADIDGDGKVDDLIEGGHFTITSDYEYSTVCPLDATCGYKYAVLGTTQLKYNNQCLSIVSPDLRQKSFDINDGGAAPYFYEVNGGAGSITVPADILEGTGNAFTANICTAMYAERFGAPGFDFDCPQGYHQLKIDLPPGYHFYPGTLVQASPPISGVTSGQYEFDDIVVTGRCGGTQTITPIIEEHCDPLGNFVTINFGRIPSSSCGPFTETYQLPCLEVPLFMDCAGGSSQCGSIPDNFGFDDLSFQLSYVCDPDCNSCVSNIVCANTTTYHHCNGECDSYFSTTNDFNFERTLLGHNNSNPIYDCNTAFDPLSNTTVLELDEAYPGDEINVSVSGSFIGNPTSMPLLTGANFSAMKLQIRHKALGAGQSGDYRLFDLKTLTGGILITNTVTSATSFVPAAALNFNTVMNVGTGNVEMNFELPNTPAGLGFISTSNESYKFEADLDLIVRTSPVVSIYSNSFLSAGEHPLISLRTEYMGVESATSHVDFSCDSWGTHFSLLQPSVAIGYYPGQFGAFNQTSTCEPYKVNVLFQPSPAQYSIGQDDFQYEFKEYANLDPAITITLPPGYHYISSQYVVAQTPYPSNGLPNGIVGTQQYVNGFPMAPVQGGYEPTFEVYPIVGEVQTGTIGTGIAINYNGLSGPGSCWPIMDMDYFSYTTAGWIEVTMQATCDAPEFAFLDVVGSYTEAIQQPDPSYHVQTNVHFSNWVLNHKNPEMAVNSPAGTFNAYSSQITFDFDICNSNAASINDGWIGIENSLANTVDLAGATVYALPGMTPVTTNTYTDLLGHVALLAHTGDQPVSACKTYRIVCNVNSNGCVPSGSDPVLDFLTIKYGAQCDGYPITQPNDVCMQGEKVFNFLRYPSDLELLLPPDAFPSGSVELCNGELEYNFVLSSFEIGAVDSLKFWLDLPAGLDFEDVIFTYPASSPTTTVTLTTFDGTDYGPGSDLSGWNPLDDLSLPYLPGTITNPDNQIGVQIHLKSTCDYNLEDPVQFYLNGNNSCNQVIETMGASSTPEFANTTIPSDLEISSDIVFSDGGKMITCNNSGEITLTVHNNSSQSNITDFTLVAEVPSPFVVDPGTGTHTGNQVTWTIPAGTIPGGGTISETYSLSLPNVEFCQNDVPLSASITFSQDVSCTSTGGSCEVTLTTEPVSFDIDACCKCSLQLAMSSEPYNCNETLGSATATVTNAAGTITYLWSDGQTTATAADLLPGTYTVTVTDEKGCTATQTVEVGLTGTPLTITATPDNDPICEGQSVSIAVGGATFYELSDGLYVETSSGDPFVISPTATTVYVLSGSNEYGCSGDVTFTVRVEPSAEPGFKLTSAYCYGATIEALPTTSLNGISGTWLPALDNTTTTTYTFTPDAGQCATVVTFTITITPLVTPTFTAVGPYCSGASISALPTTSNNGITGSWSPAIDNTATTVYTFTPTGQCASTASLMIIIDSNVTPEFDQAGPYCRGASIPDLPTTSTNGITGTWSPALNNNHTITYTFTPTAGQCAPATTMTITITPNVLPAFAAVGPYCSGSTVPALPTTSTNGITGTWSPAINNTATTTYTFTPDEGQCGTTTTLKIEIKPNVTPTFKTMPTAYCYGAAMSALPTTSANGITGTWSPALNNTATTTYTFTPTAGLCATTYTFTITINPNVTPTFSAVGPYCSGTAISALPTTSTNGITGTWSPAINNTATTTYTFTPSGGQCATITTMQIEIKPNTTPAFTQLGPYCKNAAPGTLPGTSTNGVTGTWSPSTISTAMAGTTTYTFTPTAGQCATTTTMVITVNSVVTPTFTQLGPYCKNSTPGTLPATSTNGITGTWSPSTISTASAGTIVYTFTPAEGQCAVVTTMSIVVTSLPSISVTNTHPTICNGQSPASTVLTAVVTPSTGVTYSWSPSGATTSSITVTPTVLGTQTYIVTASVGGCVVSTPTAVSYNKPPSVGVSPSNTVICSGSSVTLTATGTAGSTFGWGPATGLNTITGSSVIASPASTTTYTVTGTLNGCSATATSLVTVNPLPTISGTFSRCLGDAAVTLTGTPSGGTWSSSNTSVATITSPGGVVTPSVSNPGTTTITYTNATTGCQKTQTFTVNPLPLLPVITGPTTICDGDYATLTSSYSSGNTWSPGAATSQSISIPAPSSPTTYTVTYTSPTTGCKSSASTTVSKVTCTKPNHCVLIANFTSGVSNCNWTFTSTSTNTITIPSPGTGYTFNWTISKVSTGALITTGTGFGFSYNSFPSAGSYLVCLTVINNSSLACYDQFCKTISVTCASGMVISNNNNHLVSKFEAKGESQDVLDNLDYWWSFGDGTFSTEAKPEHKYAKPGTYEVCLRNGEMSDDLICRTITVSDDEVETGVVPILSVTPNPTSGQTSILLDGAENRTVEIKLFNMLGEEVTTLFTKTCCNDTMIRLVWNSEEVPPGVYLIKAQVDSKTIVEKVVVGSH